MSTSHKIHFWVTTCSIPHLNGNKICKPLVCLKATSARENQLQKTILFLRLEIVTKEKCLQEPWILSEKSLYDQKKRQITIIPLKSWKQTCWIMHLLHDTGMHSAEDAIVTIKNKMYEYFSSLSHLQTLICREDLSSRFCQISLPLSFDLLSKIKLQFLYSQLWCYRLL